MTDLIYEYITFQCIHNFAEVRKASGQSRVTLTGQNHVFQVISPLHWSGAFFLRLIIRLVR